MLFQVWFGGFGKAEHCVLRRLGRLCFYWFEAGKADTPRFMVPFTCRGATVRLEPVVPNLGVVVPKSAQRVFTDFGRRGPISLNAVIFP